MGCTSDLIRASWPGRRDAASVRLAHAEHTSTAARRASQATRSVRLVSWVCRQPFPHLHPICSILGQAPTSCCLNVSSIISGLPATPTSTPSQGWWLQRKRSQMPCARKSSLTGSLTPRRLKLPQGLPIPTSAVQPLDLTSRLPASCFSALV